MVLYLSTFLNYLITLKMCVCVCVRPYKISFYYSYYVYHITFIWVCLYAMYERCVLKILDIIYKFSESYFRYVIVCSSTYIYHLQSVSKLIKLSIEENGKVWLQLFASFLYPLPMKQKVKWIVRLLVAIERPRYFVIRSSARLPPYICASLCSTTCRQLS